VVSILEECRRVLARSHYRGVVQRVGELLWPPECRHCGRVESNRNWFCTNCLDGFEIVGRRTRSLGTFDAVTSVYDSIGGPLTFYQKMVRDHSKRQARIIAALMVVKYLKLDWPVPREVVAAGRYDRMVAREFVKILGTEEGSCIVVLGLDQNSFLEQGMGAINKYPNPLLGISLLGSNTF